MQVSPPFPLKEEETPAFQALLKVFGSIEDLSSIYGAIQALMKHDITLRALLIMALKHEISQRELARLLKEPPTKVQRLFVKWETAGLIEREKGYKIKSDILRNGLYKIAKQLDILIK